MIRRMLRRLTASLDQHLLIDIDAETHRMTCPGCGESLRHCCLRVDDGSDPTVQTVRCIICASVSHWEPDGDHLRHLPHLASREGGP